MYGHALLFQDIIYKDQNGFLDSLGGSRIIIERRKR
jgi:hypothetical protein